MVEECFVGRHAFREQIVVPAGATLAFLSLQLHVNILGHFSASVWVRLPIHQRQNAKMQLRRRRRVLEIELDRAPNAVDALPKAGEPALAEPRCLSSSGLLKARK